jgi:hypothetical protein
VLQRAMGLDGRTYQEIHISGSIVKQHLAIIGMNIGFMAPSRIVWLRNRLCSNDG